MEFIKRNIWAIIVVAVLCGVLGQIGDGSPPNLQDNLVASGDHF